MNEITVRSLGPGEAELHRRLRLLALRESPRAFGDTLEPLERKEGAYWEALTHRVCTEDAMFVAFSGEQPVGMIYGLRDQQVRRGARLGGVWIDPPQRRRGVGGRLVEAVFDWARSCGLDTARLWVGHEEPAAIALYRRCGFAFTGTARPLADRPEMLIREMRCAL